MAPTLTPTRQAPEIIRRFAPLTGVEMRANADTGNVDFHGYAAVFDAIADLGWWRESVRGGAFAKTLQEADVRFLFNHNPDTVMARTSAGNLQLSEDTHGLLTQAQLDRSDVDVQRLETKLRGGQVTQMSFAFRVVKEEWDDTDPRSPLRTLLEVQLYDVSPVTFPAYPETEAEAREALDQIKTLARSLAVPVLMQIPSPSEEERQDPPPPADPLRDVLAPVIQLSPAEGRGLEDDEIGLVTQAVDALQALLPPAEPRSEPAPEDGGHSEAHSLRLERARARVAARTRLIEIEQEERHAASAAGAA